MDWFDPSDDSKLIITPQAEAGDFLSKRGEEVNFGVAERFLMLQTAHDVSFLQAECDMGTESSTLPSFLGKRPLFSIEGPRRISVIDHAFGAPVAVDVLETAIAMGCRQLFCFGLCGAIASEARIGDVIVPTEVVRAEGTSYHYAGAEAAAAPDQALLRRLLDHLADETRLTVHAAKTASTDAMFRLTTNKERQWREGGVLGIDMELSALLTVAQHHRIPAVGLLVVSGKHRLGGNRHWRHGAEQSDAKRRIALQRLVEFIQQS